MSRCARFLAGVVSCGALACGGGSPAAPVPAPASVSLNALSVDPTVRGGSAASGTVTVSGPATTAVTVQLSSSSSAAVIPASVTVPAGATTAGFSIATSRVTTETAVAISAALANETKGAILRVLPEVAPALQSIEIVPSIPSGQVATGTVVLDAETAEDVAVGLSSNDSYAIPPETVTVPRGSRSAVFTVQTRSSSVSFDAVISASAGGQTRSATLRLLATLPAGPAPPPASGRAGTFLRLDPEAGEVITRGAPVDFTPADGPFRAVSSCGGAQLHIRLEVNRVPWALDFQTPRDSWLTAGVTYRNARRFPFHPPTAPGLSVAGNHLACNTLFGSFTVHEIELGPNRTVNRFRATFEQRCTTEGAPILYGEVNLVNPQFVDTGDYCGGFGLAARR